MIEPALFGLLAALLWAVSDFVSRGPSRRMGYYATTAYVQAIGFAFLAIFVLSSAPERLVLAHYTMPLLGLNVLAGAFNFLGFVFLYRGLSGGIMSIVGPIASSYPIVTISLSILFLGTAVGFINGAGIAIVIFGVLLSGVNIADIYRLRSRKAEQDRTASALTSKIAAGGGSAIIAALSFGTLYFFLDFVTSKTDFIVPVLFMRLASAAIAFGLILPLRIKFVRPDLKIFGIIAFMGITDTMGYVAFDAGVLSAGNSLPIVVTLSSLVGVVTLILARVFYKEGVNTLQWVGIAAITIGVLIVLYF